MTVNVQNSAVEEDKLRAAQTETGTPSQERSGGETRGMDKGLPT